MAPAVVIWFIAFFDDFSIISQFSSVFCPLQISKPRFLTTPPMRNAVFQFSFLEIPKNSKNIRNKIRDKAIILVGFSGGFRRSELVAIDYEDIEFVNEGVKIFEKSPVEKILKKNGKIHGVVVNKKTIECHLWISSLLVKR